jgi:SNF2 family DNA or RNA helicase
MPKSEIDVFSQYEFMDPSIFGPWKQFARTYLRKGGFMNKQWQLKRHMREQFEDTLHAHAYRITTKEAIGLPNIGDQKLLVRLDGRALKAYEELHNELVTQIDDTTTTTPYIVTQMLRLQQITGGWLHGDDGTSLRVGTHKLSALRDFLDDFSDRIVVFARFLPELEDIAHTLRSLGRRAYILTGQTKDRSIWRQFNEDRSRNAAFLAQISTGGIGIDLTTASTAIFYSKTFNWDDYDQARFRLLGPGQREKVTFISIVAENTIDTYISSVLSRKCSVARRILDLYRKERRWLRS